MKRIVLTGAESTGKSTLAKAIAAHYDAPLSHEYVRHYVDKLDRELDLQDLLPIARGQIAAENDAVQQAERIAFHDTNILSSIIYAQHYFEQSIPEADQALKTGDYTLYLLCEADIPWVADAGQRESPQTREHLQQKFETELSLRKLPHLKISGSLEARLRQAINAIDALSK